MNKLGTFLTGIGILIFAVTCVAISITLVRDIFHSFVQHRPGDTIIPAMILAFIFVVVGLVLNLASRETSKE